MKSRTMLVLLVGTVLLAAGGIGAWTTASQGASAEPPTSGVTRFELSVDGHTLAVFSELEGISSGIDVVELSDKDGTFIKLPGTQKPASLTLKRGLTLDMTLSAWHELAMTDVEAARKDATLTLYDAAGAPVARWHFEDAWPAKWELGTLAAGTSSLAIEKVTIVCERVTRAAP